MSGIIENNQVRIMGVYPGVDMEGIRTYHSMPDFAAVARFSGVESNSSSFVYTVPVGKKFYLCNCHFALRRQDPGAANSISFIDNGSGTTWYRFFRIGLVENVSMFLPFAFNPPLAVQAGYRFWVQSGAVSMDIDYGFHGYVI